MGFAIKPFEDNEIFSQIPEAKGDISAIGSEAFFFPFYGLYLTYGGIFSLMLR
ncbi:hypothetical protein SOVF_145980 [Spinacia oleracea]|nr:hypothetical protein SOVF_145980 [Spinacia oleracea]